MDGLYKSVRIDSSTLEAFEEKMLRDAIERSKAESHPKHPEANTGPSVFGLSGAEEIQGNKRKGEDGEPAGAGKRTRLNSPTREGSGAGPSCSSLNVDCSLRLPFLNQKDGGGSDDGGENQIQPAMMLALLAALAGERNQDEGNVPSDGDAPRAAGDGEFKECTVNPDTINETFDDVHVHPSVIDSLNILTLSLEDPAAFKIGILSRCTSMGVLLYGPPGSGKTLLVRALAKQRNAKMLAISGADIRSRYVGQGEKKIKRLFAYARQSSPCIIFIDEADSIFRSRSAEDNNRGHLSDLNQFLTEMDGIHSAGADKPMVIAASNRPFDMDEGVLRRLGRRLLVDVPDVVGREKILGIHLKGEKLDPELDLREIAQHTNDYTGSDLKDLVQAAAIEAVREKHLQNAQVAGQSGTDPKPGLGRGGADRILNRDHFLLARRLVSPAPKSDLVTAIREFHTKFGSVGALARGRYAKVEKINKTKGCDPDMGSSSHASTSSAGN